MLWNNSSWRTANVLPFNYSKLSPQWNPNFTTAQSKPPILLITSMLFLTNTSPVAVQADTCLPGKWLLPHVWQYSVFSTVSWRPDLHATTNIQQLWRRNVCSRWTSFVELFTGLTAQSRHHLLSVSTTAEGTCFWEPWTRHSGTSDMQRLRTASTYLLTYLPHFSWSHIGSIQSCTCWLLNAHHKFIQSFIRNQWQLHIMFKQSIHNDYMCLNFSIRNAHKWTWQKAIQ